MFISVLPKTNIRAKIAALNSQEHNGW
jgi:hypothetical protein